MTQQQTVGELREDCVSCGGRGKKFVLPRCELVAVRSEGAREPLAVLGLEPCSLCGDGGAGSVMVQGPGVGLGMPWVRAGRVLVGAAGEKGAGVAGAGG